MKGIAAMRRRIRRGEWEGRGFAGENTASTTDGYTGVLYVDDEPIGHLINNGTAYPYSFVLGEYPTEEYHGVYRTENAALNELAHVLIEKSR